MRLGANHRKALIALAIVVAFVAVVVPTCRMVGCTMNMSGMGASHSMGLGLFSDCPGQLISTSAPTAVVPSSADSLVLAVAFAVFAAAVMARPQVRVVRIRSHASDPPPPPEDPAGERLRL